MLERNEETLKEGLGDSHKELREVSAENRREMNNLFKEYQDALVKRVEENSGKQNRQLNSFKDTFSVCALAELSLNRLLARYNLSGCQQWLYRLC